MLNHGGAQMVTDVFDAAVNGNYRDLLVAMRDRIAEAISAPNCPPRDLAALTRRLTDIAKEINSLDLAAEQEESERVPSDAAFNPSAI